MRASRLLARAAVLAYLGLLLVVPVGLIFWRTFGAGVGTAWASVTSPEALHALCLTLFVTAIAVPVNTVFGVLGAIVLTRHSFPGRGMLSTLVDLPFAVSPVVVGLALIFVYGSDSWAGGQLAQLGVQVIFSVPGIVIATAFASLPFVIREVAPVLEEIGTDQEQASFTLGASPWQAFWRVTLPSIRSAVAYGVVLTTARAIGEFGAVSVVSGRLLGQTQTLTLLVEERFQDFDPVGAYAAGAVLALLSVGTLLVMNLLKPRRGAR